MTPFIIGCAVMITAALLWLLLPMLRPREAKEAAGDATKERRVSAAVVAVLVPALAVSMYASLSDWDFDAAASASAQTEEMDDLLQKLEARLKANPQDVEGWMLLGRSYAAVSQFPRAVFAFEHANAAAGGENVEAMVNLAEALTLSDQSALSGRAGELLDQALSKAPQHPKALWYGAQAALSTGKFETARDRLEQLLAQNPPPEVRGIVERQIQDVNQQLGGAGEGGRVGEGGPASAAAAKPAMAAEPATKEAAPAASGRSIKVTVTISPEIQKQLSGAMPLFVLARDPAGGPPLAAQRHSTSAAPLSIVFTEKDSMMPTHTLGNTPRVQVVARISKSGGPQARSGDYFGEAEYDFSKGDAGAVKIVVDRTVP